ncbi:MAG: DUF721 domain-containing protein [Planctomycetaceae bacterium]|nr:DUF721 domain-containing protein [Planctomycetaceae bacterium]
MKKKKSSGIGKKNEELLQRVLVRRRKELCIRGGGPVGIGNPLREVLARRKIGRQLQSLELTDLWKSSIEVQFIERTKVVSLRNGVLLIDVSDSVLMSELSNFHKRQILRDLNQKRPEMEIKNLKFRLNAKLGK